MFKVCPHMSCVLLTLALSLSAAAAASAQQGAQQKSDNPCKGQPPLRQRQGTAGGGANQPRQQDAVEGEPMTAGQKVGCAFRGAFLSPAPYVASIFSGGIRQIGEDR